MGTRSSSSSGSVRRARRERARGSVFSDDQHTTTQQQHNKKTKKTETLHTFSATETDWGFTQFLPLSDVTAERGYVSADDAVTLRATIRVQRDERFSYDSRAETGHVGLKNQGATCYMNSLLQYLFHIPALRKAVYDMPTSESDEPGSCMPLALQVFVFVVVVCCGVFLFVFVCCVCVLLPVARAAVCQPPATALT